MTIKDEQKAGSEDEDFGAAFRDSMGGAADDPFVPEGQGDEGDDATGKGGSEEEAAGSEEGKAGSEEPGSEEGKAGSEGDETEESPAAGDGGVPPDHGTPPAGAAQPSEKPQAQPPETPPSSGEPASTQGQPPQPQQPPVQQQQQPPAEPEQDLDKDWTEYLTDEEKSTLSTYDDEWGEVSEAEKIRTQAMVRQAEERILKQVNQVLNPVVSKIQTRDVEEHFSTIRSKHSDFDTLRQGPLQEWVANMPNTMVRKAAEGVLQQGTTEEVIELLDMYKEDKGIKKGPGNTGQSTGAAPSVPASSQAPAQPGTQQGNEAGKGGGTPPKPGVDPDAVSATAAVTAGSRGADPRGDDPDDFQAGFAETAAG